MLELTRKFPGTRVALKGRQEVAMKIAVVAIGFAAMVISLNAGQAFGASDLQLPNSVIQEIKTKTSFSASQENGLNLKQLRQAEVFQRFSFEIDGVSVGGVHKVDGLTHEHEVVEYQDGDDSTTHFRPGRQKPGRLVITRDWSSTDEIAKWIKEAGQGQSSRKSISIVFRSDDGIESARIQLSEVGLTKWTGPKLDAKNSGHATEIIELIFETLDFKDATPTNCEKCG